MTAYRLHRLGWTQEEIGQAIGLNQRTVSDTILPEFPDLEKSVRKLLNEGHPHLDVAERFNTKPRPRNGRGKDSKKGV